VIVRERGVADLPFWITIGGGAAALLAAVITGPIALDRASSRDGLVLSDPAMLEAYQAQYAALDSDARALGITTDVLIAVGAAALVAGLLLFVLREQVYEREMDETALLPVMEIGEHSASIGVRGTL
jgi:hypothetical protein